MTQAQRRALLIRSLLDEDPRLRGAAVPAEEKEQKRLLRALLNVRAPGLAGGEFLAVQDAYLRAETAAKGITNLDDLTPAEPGLYLWQGDITTLRVDAIVNAANSGMTGCYIPNHRCIDNCIHTFAGVQLRWDCAQRLARQGHEAETGSAWCTPGYDLPCRCILHTVGPIVDGPLTDTHRRQLAACYRACLDLAARNDLHSVAFCCISTGEFHFPNDAAARIAIDTVRGWRRQHQSEIKVIFNVFKDIDYKLYAGLLGH